MAQQQNDFSQGSVYRHVLSLALPMTVAQLVQILYNVVDRIYIGHLPGASSLALTGLGLTFPVITLILAFTNLFGMGGAPLCSIARGRGDTERAERIMGSTLTMLLAASVVLTVLGQVFLRPLLFLFGASDDTWPYAAAYLRIYLIGTPLAMVGTGMNGFINAQGFGRVGMVTTLMGAAANIVLDPVFIFLLDMGVSGAAVATVLSQLLSAAWVMRFLLGRRTLLKLRPANLRPDWPLVGEIARLGTAGFVMSASNGAVQIACNTTLRAFGGDVYVGVMTVLSSVRDVVSLPCQGLNNASQPVLGFNFGARKYDRVVRVIRFTAATSVGYMLLAWLAVFLFPRPIMSVFNNSPALLDAGAPAMHLYFFGFFMMALQISAQSVFVGLGLSRQAIFFSILRKIIIVVPLTLLLPHVGGLGVNGVFLAEPISNFIGGAASFTTMVLTLRHRSHGRAGESHPA